MEPGKLKSAIFQVWGNADKFLLLLCIIPFLQLPFLGNEVYAPHAWRQLDTLGYAYSFYSEQNALFYPEVYWMGGYKTLLLEFPITEYIQAVFFQLLGYSIKLGQFINLIYFSFCLAFFYKLIKILFNKEVAIYSSLCFFFLPVVFFYSHAFLVDFFALGCGFAFSYYFILGLQNKSFKSWIYATLFLSLSLLVKAPTSFYLALPLLIFTIYKAEWNFVIKYGGVFILSLIPFYFWIQHSTEINALAPNWKSIIPDYRKFDDMSMWYYGLWEHRFIPYSWYTLAYRFTQELTGGIFIFILSVFGIFWSFLSKNGWFVLGWLMGLLAMLLIFFNLNAIHNYYQLPFMAIIAMGLGYFLYQFNRWKSHYKYVVVILFFGFMGFSSYTELKTSYYHATEFKEMGIWLGKKSLSSEYIITSYGGLSAQCPLILSTAHRFGWSVSAAYLKPELILELMKHGADKFFLVSENEPGGELKTFMDFFSCQKHKASNGLTYYLVDLKHTQSGEVYFPESFH